MPPLVFLKKCEYCQKSFKAKPKNKRFCSTNCKGYNKSKKDRVKKREFILNYKKDKRCFKCGWNSFPPILEFHHKKIEDKENDISFLVHYPSKNYDLIKKEMNKCVLLCPNCHKILHFKEKKINEVYETLI